MKKNKPCKRRKCPHYKESYRLCMICEWNPIGKWCPKIQDNPDLEFERDCEYYKVMTQADRIRNMTDEELAEHFSDLIKDTKEHEYCDDVSDWLEWLQSPVEV